MNAPLTQLNQSNSEKMLQILIRNVNIAHTSYKIFFEKSLKYPSETSYSGVASPYIIEI